MEGAQRVQAAGGGIQFNDLAHRKAACNDSAARRGGDKVGVINDGQARAAVISIGGRRGGCMGQVPRGGVQTHRLSKQKASKRGG